MAKSNNPLVKGLRGSINRQIVIKQYAHCTVITIFPDMSRVVRSSRQKKNTKFFAQAVKYAKEILSDPEKYQAYKKALAPGQRVYNQAIREYMQLVTSGLPFNTEDEAIQKPFNTKDEANQKPFNTEVQAFRKRLNTKEKRLFSLGNYDLGNKCGFRLKRRRWRNTIVSPPLLC